MPLLLREYKQEQLLDKNNYNRSMVIDEEYDRAVKKCYINQLNNY